MAMLKPLECSLSTGKVPGTIAPVGMLQTGWENHLERFKTIVSSAGSGASRDS